jgi:hypothetical protein
MFAVLTKVKKGIDFGLDVRLDPIGNPELRGQQKYFKITVIANVLGTDEMFDGRRHEWTFGSIKVLSTGAFFYWGDKKDDIRLFKDNRHKNVREMMKKLGQKLSKLIAPNHGPIIYHDKVIHKMCAEIHNQLIVYGVMMS